MNLDDDTIFDLGMEVIRLKRAQLHRVDFLWIDLYPDPYVNLSGVVFNSGNETVYDANMTVNIYDILNTLINSDEIHLGHIEGKNYTVFDVDIYCQYYPDSVYTLLDWNYGP